MKVFLQKPWRVSDSPYYKYLLGDPPEGIDYVNPGDFGLIQSPLKMKAMHWLKSFIKKSFRKYYPSMPNAHFTKDYQKYNLIHCTHCLSRNQYPWIADTEYVGQFWVSTPSMNCKYKKKIRKYLHSDYCKKILAWTDWTKKGIVKEFPEIKEKVVTVYPAIPSQKITLKDKGKNKTIKLLFVSRRFYFKGGLYAIEVMDKLTKKYKNVEATIVSDTPIEVLEKYQSNKKISFKGMMLQKELFGEIYTSHDIFIYPSFTDTFGFPIVESMSFGLPVISCSGQSRKELIENNKTGFVIESGFGDNPRDNLRKIDEKLVNSIVGIVGKLIKNRDLLNQMRKNCLDNFKKGGKFSISRRDEQLKRIYNEAIL